MSHTQGGPPVPIQSQQPLGYGGMEPPQQQSYGYPGPGQGMMPPAQPPAAAPVPVAKVAEPPRPKPPLPEEHMYLQTVFDELRNRCTCAASNPVRSQFKYMLPELNFCRIYYKG